MKLTTKLLRQLIREAMNEGRWDSDEPYGGNVAARSAAKYRKRGGRSDIENYPRGREGYLPLPKYVLQKGFEINPESGQLELDPRGKRVSMRLHAFLDAGQGMAAAYNTPEQNQYSIDSHRKFLQAIVTGLDSVEGYNSIVGPGSLEAQAQELNVPPDQLLEAYRGVFFQSLEDMKKTLETMPTEPNPERY